MSQLTKFVPHEESFSSWLRSPAVAARIGIWVGVTFGIAFLTGLISHWAQLPQPAVPFPTRPVWGYRLSQGLHVASGTAAIPLLLVKLWTVYPRLFAKLPRGLRQMALTGLERGSIGILVAASIFMLVTGTMNSAQWYPWSFSFRVTHYTVAWIAIGALIIHIAVKLPVIRTALAGDLNSTAQDRDGTQVPSKEDGGLSRRGLLRSTWVAAGVAVLATAGSTVPMLRRVSVFGVRSGDGPGGIPINRSARAAGVTATATASSTRLTISYNGREVELTPAELVDRSERSEELPIACVEGWSASGTWTGIRVRDLLDLVEAPRGSDVRVVSLQTRGAFGRTILPGNFADDPLTLVATALNGERLSLDHGFPCRIIAPNRPGVLQTKWVTRLEVMSS